MSTMSTCICMWSNLSIRVYWKPFVLAIIVNTGNFTKLLGYFAPFTVGLYESKVSSSWIYSFKFVVWHMHTSHIRRIGLSENMMLIQIGFLVNKRFLFFVRRPLSIDLAQNFTFCTCWFHRFFNLIDYFVICFSFTDKIFGIELISKNLLLFIRSKHQDITFWISLIFLIINYMRQKRISIFNVLCSFSFSENKTCWHSRHNPGASKNTSSLCYW